MARPTKPKGESRDKLMQIRVQQREQEIFREAANACGLDVSSWARERLIQAAKKDLKQ